MGACKNHSIHPAYVKMPNKKEKISLRIEKLPKDIQPIVIIINPKSGGQIGETALKAFYSLVNPIQVIDVFCDYSRLKLFENMSDLRILIAGGDGTVSKLLGTLYDDDWKGEKPPIGIFPLGTGNDLSVVFNWGKGIKSRKGKNIGSMIECARDVIKSACKAYPSNLDRWVVRFKSKNKVKSFTMCNYLGIGVDAKIADDFDKLRKTKPYLFQSRVIFI
jgi:diacylglycerol kinase (ATP)